MTSSTIALESSLERLTAAATAGDAAALAGLAVALFCSPLQPSSCPGRDMVLAALGRVLPSYQDEVRRCACDVAESYGADQSLARDRMRWCRDVVTACVGVGP